MEYLTTTQVSQETGIPQATLRYWRHINSGPPSFALGKRIVYRRLDLNQWIQDQEKATTRGGSAAS